MRLVRAFTLLVTVGTVIYAIRTRQSHGTFLKIPFEFRVPTLRRVRESLWNPQDERILTPHPFGVGWSPNVYQVLRRLGFVEKEVGTADASPEREE